MTFDPVLPPLALGMIAVALIALRMLALRRAERSRSGVLRWCTTTLALLFVLVAAARPGTGTAPETAAAPTRTGANVYFLVDRSVDTSGIRDDIATLMDSHPGARFGMIAFASRPVIDWPLSSDAWSLEPVVAALAPYPGADVDQVNAAAAANVLRYQLIAAGQQYPGADNLVYYFGSGAPQSTAPQGVFDTDAVDGGAVFGYGPRLDEARLRDIAGQLGVSYVHRGAAEPLPSTATAADEGPPAAADTPRRVEYYWVFTMLAALLLLAEIYLSVRELQRARSSYRETA